VNTFSGARRSLPQFTSGTFSSTSVLEGLHFLALGAGDLLGREEPRGALGGQQHGARSVDSGPFYDARCEAKAADDRSGGVRCPEVTYCPGCGRSLSEAEQSSNSAFCSSISGEPPTRKVTSDGLNQLEKFLGVARLGDVVVEAARFRQSHVSALRVLARFHGGASAASR
jgi:hypothetical protein